MELKDVYYKLTDSNYSKRSKDAAKMLEGYTKKHSDYFMTQDKVAIILSKGIKYISQISNTPKRCLTSHMDVQLGYRYLTNVKNDLCYNNLNSIIWYYRGDCRWKICAKSHYVSQFFPVLSQKNL